MVSRPRVLARLAESLSKRLTLIEAPAGFGKTTLLCEWRQELLDQHAAAVAWLTLGHEDEHPKQVLSDIAEAMRRASRGRLDRTRALLATDPSAPVGTIVSVLIDEIAEFDSELVLILDDYEFVYAPAVHEALHAMLLRAPENMHVCIASRARVPLQISAWRAAREVVEVNESDLRFQNDETRAFLANARHHRLDYFDAHALCAATEGWVTGLQIAALPAHRRTDRELRDSTRRNTWTYLQENVLAGLPAELLEFLLQTSILARLSSGLCAAVTGSQRSAALLESLAARNLFIVRLGESDTWFRYHRLFSDFLQAELGKRDPGFVAELHRRAANWHAQSGEWAQAVKHALAAGDVDQAEAWIERCAMSLVEAGDLHTLVHWSLKLSPESLRARVGLRFALTWTLALFFRFSEAESAIAGLEADDAALAVELTPSQRLELRAVRALSTALADNDSAGTARLAAACLREMPKGDTWMHRIVRNVLTWAYTQNHEYAAARATQLELADDGEWGSKLFAPTCRNGLLGMGWTLQGRLSRAAALYSDVAGFAEKSGRYSAASSYLACFQAELAYESDDLEGVGELLAGRWDTIDEVCSLDAVLRAYTSAARVESARRDEAAALHLLERGRAIGARRDWHRLVCALDAEKIRLCLIAGRVSEARACYNELEDRCANLPRDASGSPERSRDYRRDSLARILIDESAYDAAIELLRRAIEKFSERRANLLVVRTSVLLAKALVRAKRSFEARPVLVRALAYAGNEPFVRSFLDEGAEITTPLMRALAEVPADPAFVVNRSRWIAIFERSFRPNIDSPQQRGTKNPASEQLTKTIASLSVREQQILSALAEGNHNKEIASLLLVSPETVKWHLKRIYDKLSVGSRTEAARLAVMSGLA